MVSTKGFPALSKEYLNKLIKFDRNMFWRSFEYKSRGGSTYELSLKYMLLGKKKNHMLISQRFLYRETKMFRVKHRREIRNFFYVVLDESEDHVVNVKPVSKYYVLNALSPDRQLSWLTIIQNAPSTKFKDYREEMYQSYYHIAESTGRVDEVFKALNGNVRWTPDGMVEGVIQPREWFERTDEEWRDYIASANKGQERQNKKYGDLGNV